MKKMSRKMNNFQLIILVILIGNRQNGVWGQVMCYACAWSLFNLPSAQNVSDVCRPKNFNMSVHNEMCPFGCVILHYYDYEYEEEKKRMTTKRTATKGPSMTPGSRFNGTELLFGILPLTFYIRECAKVQNNIEGCQIVYEESGFYETCYCNTDFCNGELASAGSLLRATFPLLATISLLLLIN